MLKFFVINFVPIMAAAVGQWVLGALWFSPVLFGRTWKSAIEGEVKEDKRMAFGMLLSFIANIIVSTILLHMILLNGVYGLKRGAYFGLVVAAGLIAAPMAATYIYEKRPMKLFFINAGYWIVAIVICSAVMARRFL